MALFFSPNPSREDIHDFMDDDERHYWDTQQGTPEERVKFWESLEALWRSIPDPTEEEFQPPLIPYDTWQGIRDHGDKSGAITFYRRKWKKDRKAEAIARRAEGAKQSEPPTPQPDSTEPLFSPSSDKPDWVDTPDAVHLSLDGEAMAEPSHEPPGSDEAPTEDGDQEHPITPRVRREIEDQGKWGVDWPQKSELPESTSGDPKLFPPPNPHPPWFKRGELVLAALAISLGGALAICLVLLPAKSPSVVVFWLILLFGLLAFSVVVIARFFDWSPTKMVAGLLGPLAVVAVVTVFAWPESKSVEEKRQQPIQGPTAQSPPPSAASKEFTNVDPGYLVGLYKKYNSVQADEIAKHEIGKWVKISGTFSNVERDKNSSDRATARMSMSVEGDDGWIAYAVISEIEDQRWIDRALALRPEEKITIVGRIKRVIPPGIILEKCEIVE